MSGPTVSAPTSPQAPLGPYTVSLSVDLEGIGATSSLHALELALEAIRFAVPTIATGVETGGIAHVIPTHGPYEEWHIKTMRRVGEAD